MRRSAEWALVLIFGACASAAHGGERPKKPSFKVSPAAAERDALAGLMTRADPAGDGAALDWRSTAVPLSSKARLRISIAGADPATPRGLAATTRDRAYELSLERDWPSAVSFRGGALSPHAAVGVTPHGGMAEAGATLQLGQRVDNALQAGLDALGVADGERFGDAGRWYLFAAASGRAVGLNMLRSESGLSRAGWTTDEASTLVGDAQVGVGWRKGAMQTSFGVLHREVKAQHPYHGYKSRADQVVAFSFAVKPR